MKFVIKTLLVLPLLLICVGVKAQPRPPQNPQIGDIDSVRLHRQPTQAPVAPVTLLLLGLGASAVGVKLHKNSKKQ